MVLPRELPPSLRDLHDLALDMRWTWCHEADALWSYIDAPTWRKTHNPWTILNDISANRIAELATDEAFIAHLEQVAAARRRYLSDSGWFAAARAGTDMAGVAWFSMEFGLSGTLPLYAGGLGVLAGDVLKAASDLGVPVIGIGLLYQEGYFRQMIDATGWQQEAYPFNEPAGMPLERISQPDNGSLVIPIELPGRTLRLRAWRAIVGRTRLYLLDSNDPMNDPIDRGITGKLYGGGSEIRLMQEIVLGVAGWRLVEALHPEIEVCHLNEGHAAFAVLERARHFAKRHGLTFTEALWATRAGNVFTTHTPVKAGFDRYDMDLLARYAQVWAEDIDLAAVVRLGREDGTETFSMAHLAARGALRSFGVSRLHGAVSRQIFQPLFPRWPEHEVPFDHITNGVHVPTWDSAASDAFWTEAGGKDRWRQAPENPCTALETISDEAFWAMRGVARGELVRNVRARLRLHLGGRGHPPDVVALAETVLDPNVLTLGFARRFTDYKRPDLLLRDRARLEALLHNETRPIQLVVSGKAHPEDQAGKRMIQQWIQFAQEPPHRHRVVFLEDYDIAVAQELVQGVDVWVNTPRRPWEACGTSGMKVLVNGGLNLSTLDGWWEEAYAPELGWAIGERRHTEAAEQDRHDTAELFAVLENEVIPAFYDRDTHGVPRGWVARMRCAMIGLTSRFSATRLLRDYIDKAYLPAAQALRERIAGEATVAKALAAWELCLHRAWPEVHIGQPAFVRHGDGWDIAVIIYLGEIEADYVRGECYADASDGHPAEIIPLSQEQPILGATGGYVYRGRISGMRPAGDYTIRVVPYHPGVRVPTEIALVRWQE